ncbi:MAG: PP2C family protein-serine/threonine phosphatase [Phycisphaerae bacterium]
MNQPVRNLKADELARILQVTRTLAAAADLQEVLSLIVDCAMSLLDAERASVFLYQPDSNELVTRVAAGVEQIRIPADRGIAGATISQAQTILVEDAYQDDRFNPDVDKQTGFVTRNILSLPLKGHRGDLVGVLQIINKTSGSFDGSDVTLAEAFGAQAGVALQRAGLIQHYQQKIAMERALSLAREIQQGLLPQTQPQVEGFDLAGRTRPADRTGGDAFDFFQLPDGRWMLLVGDATGHGIGPALVMTETRAMLRAISLHGRADCCEVLAAVNDLLELDLNSARFVTCFYALLDSRNDRLDYASAGHGPNLLYRAESGRIQTLPASGPPLAVVAGMKFDCPDPIRMQPGDILLVPSDGFAEAKNPLGEMFTNQRIESLLKDHASDPACRIVETLFQQIDRFVGPGAQEDDLTVIALKKT